MRDLGFMVWAFAVGLMPVMQAGINADLGRRLGGPLRAGLTNFVVGALVLIPVVLLFSRGPWPTYAGLAKVPAWNWLGGLCGATLVMTMIVVSPRLGSALFFALLVSGQVVASVIIDWLGWLGYEARPPHPLRLLGVALLIGGVALVSVYR